jgi:hypothetical protein
MTKIFSIRTFILIITRIRIGSLLFPFAPLERTLARKANGLTYLPFAGSWRVARGVRVIISLVAVIGLTLTAVSGCATSEDSSSTVASEAEAPEPGSVAADCATIIFEIDKMADDNRRMNIEPNTQEAYTSYLKAHARMWPQISDPDLKSITREISNRDNDTNADDDPNTEAIITICRPYWN